MKRLLSLMAGSVFALALMPAVQAMPMHFSAMLSGPGESPPNASAGTGWVMVTIDGAAHTLQVDVTFSGLTGLTTASHIHCCVAPPGATGVATEVPSFSNLPLGVTSGSFTEMFDMSLLSSYNPAFVAANGGTAASAEAALFWGIRHDMAYLNIHTTSFRGGEIRGFLTPAPEPATLALLGAGLLGAFGARKRMKKS